MTDEELEAIVDELAGAGGMGGMGIGTIYGDLAIDVAKAVRERCAVICDTLPVNDPAGPWFNDDMSMAAYECAAAIRSVA